VNLPAGGLVDLTASPHYDAARIDHALSRSNLTGKVIVAAFNGSSVLQQLPALAPLPWEMEVLTPAYMRTMPAFGDNGWWQRGTLQPPPELDDAR